MQPWETSAMPGLPTAAVGQAIRPERRCQVFFRAYGMEQELVLPTCCVRPLSNERSTAARRFSERSSTTPTGKAGAEHDQHEQCEPRSARGYRTLPVPPPFAGNSPVSMVSMTESALTPESHSSDAADGSDGSSVHSSIVAGVAPWPRAQGRSRTRARRPPGPAAASTCASPRSRTIPTHRRVERPAATQSAVTDDPLGASAATRRRRADSRAPPGRTRSPRDARRLARESRHRASRMTTPHRRRVER